MAGPVGWIFAKGFGSRDGDSYTVLQGQLGMILSG